MEFCSPKPKNNAQPSSSAWFLSILAWCLWKEAFFKLTYCHDRDGVVHVAIKKAHTVSLILCVAEYPPVTIVSKECSQWT